MEKYIFYSCDTEKNFTHVVWRVDSRFNGVHWKQIDSNRKAHFPVVIEYSTHVAEEGRKSL